MLVMVMHDRRGYLEFLLSFVKGEGITDAIIIEKEGIGSYLIGEKGIFIFNKNKYSGEYDRALVAVIKREEKIKRLLHFIKNDDTLKMLGLRGKGIVCTMPFQQIKLLELESTSVKKVESKVKIRDYLKDKRILLNIKARSKEESIKEIATLLRDSKDVVDFETFLKDVFAREELATTGIGSEIAIPHARTDSVKDLVIAFGMSQEGVEFNSVDGKPAKLIFLMGTPKEKELGNYLKILSRLTRLLDKESFRNSLLKANSPKEIIDEFERYDK